MTTHCAPRAADRTRPVAATADVAETVLPRYDGLHRVDPILACWYFVAGISGIFALSFGLCLLLLPVGSPEAAANAAPARHAANVLLGALGGVLVTGAVRRRQDRAAAVRTA